MTPFTANPIAGQEAAYIIGRGREITVYLRKEQEKEISSTVSLSQYVDGMVSVTGRSEKI